MDLRFEAIPAAAYSSRSQIARVATQAWVRRELPCLACSAHPLRATPENTRSRDFVCAGCGEPYELKSTAGRFGRWVPDGAYATFLETIRLGRTPNLLLLEYDRDDRSVRELRAVHRTLISPLALAARRPLLPPARRAGWQGCSLDLGLVPPSGRVPIVTAREPLPWPEVTAAWSAYAFMVRLREESRGWLRDVLAVIERLPRRPFRLEEAYAFEEELAALHPGNRNVRPKIRQQLQRLVLEGRLQRLRPGLYAPGEGVPAEAHAE